MPDYFALGDTNKDGYIDCDEFRAISATFDIPVTKSDVSWKYNENPLHIFLVSISVLGLRGIVLVLAENLILNIHVMCVLNNL